MGSKYSPPDVNVCNPRFSAVSLQTIKISMKISKFEAIGIGFSIAAMSLALFLLRVDGLFTPTGETVSGQTASVVVASKDNTLEALSEALNEAKSPISNNLEKLIVNDVIVGFGKEVKEGDTVEVNYIGTLQNGQQFDNSYQKGQPFIFTVGEGKVIQGWDDGILGMKVGGQRILVVPSALAYGDDGYGPVPGGATLVFAVELLSIKE